MPVLFRYSADTDPGIAHPLQGDLPGWTQLILGHLRADLCLNACDEVAALTNVVNAAQSRKPLPSTFSDICSRIEGASLPVVPHSIIAQFLYLDPADCD